MPWRLDRSRGATAGSLLAAFSFGFGLAATITAPAVAQDASPLDPHRIFEQRCMRCHTGHGADLARQKLIIADDELRVARTGKALPALLTNHHGARLGEPELKALLSLFEDGIERKGAFQHRCALCHGRAVDFARDKLAVKDGGLIAKSDGKDVATFLRTHHEASPDELAAVVSALTEHLQTKP